MGPPILIGTRFASRSSAGGSFSGEERIMPRAKPAKLEESDVQGLRCLARLSGLLERLHGAGCERDRASQRELHYDQYCLLILLAMFNPLAASLRALQQATELQKVRAKLGVGRTSYGSLSEAVQVFDPELLRPIVAELAAELRPQRIGRDPRLAELRHTLTLVDGTMLVALPKIAAAAWGGQPVSRRGFAWRLHTHFEVLTGTVPDVELTGFKNAGDDHERRVLKRKLEPDRCYVIDRGYQWIGLFNAIHAARSSYVCRIAEKAALQVEEQRPLSDEAQRQGVVQDAVVRLGHDYRAHPDHAVRVVTLEVKPHVKRSGHKGKAGPANRGRLLLVTNLLDVPAEILALLYQYRWQIELFFRFFKCTLGCGHLLSHHKNGIQIQAYCALLACLLLSLYTGRRPTKRDYEMFSWYLLGLASEEELARHREKHQRDKHPPRTP
jgi:hypothetical protein